MMTLLIALLLGLFIGTLRSTPQKVTDMRHTLLKGGIVFLIFTMGVSIGTNPEIIHNLKSVGSRAFFLALSSTLGALLFAFFTEKYLRQIARKEHENDQNHHG